MKIIYNIILFLFLRFAQEKKDGNGLLMNLFEVIQWPLKEE